MKESCKAVAWRNPLNLVIGKKFKTVAAASTEQLELPINFRRYGAIGVLGMAKTVL